MTNETKLSYHEIMIGRCGLVLLDWTEVVVRIYEQPEKGIWKTIFATTHDLSTHPNVLSSPTPFIDVITDASKKGSALGVNFWEVYARYLPNQILYDITQTIAVPIKKLTLQQEQELLCKGTLLRM